MWNLLPCLLPIPWLRYQWWWPVQQWAGVILSRFCLPAHHALKRTGWCLQGKESSPQRPSKKSVRSPQSLHMTDVWTIPDGTSEEFLLVGLVTDMEENSNSFRYQSLKIRHHAVSPITSSCWIKKLQSGISVQRILAAVYQCKCMIRAINCKWWCIKYSYACRSHNGLRNEESFISRFYHQCLSHVFRRHIIDFKIRIINTYVLGVMGASVLWLAYLPSSSGLSC